MPGGEELVVSEEGVPRDDEKELPKIDGDEEKQLTTILSKLKVTRNNTTFEYYYLLGRLIEEYPATIRKKIHQKCHCNYNKSGKLVNLAKKTVVLFNTVGLSYLSLQKLRPRNLLEMTDGNFEK
ncbi:1542_t:CDS:2 [Entrophospora sp. SA101]|nr:1542_t:CDS:2 [Entrophospora sp. SA101]